MTWSTAPRTAALTAALLAALLVAALASGAGCNDKKTLPFTVYTPPGPSVFQGATQVRMTFAGHETTVPLTGPDDAFELSMKLKPGDEGRVVLEGLDSSGRAICVGRSPDIVLSGLDEPLILYVGRIGTFGATPGSFPSAAHGVTVATYEQEDWDTEEHDDIQAAMFFGGRTGDGNNLATPQYYDIYQHAVAPLSETTAPRAYQAAFDVDGGNFVLFGGETAPGETSAQLDLMLPGLVSFEHFTDHPYGQTPPTAARAGSANVTLGPYESYFADAQTRVQNSFLLVGGWNDAGTRCDYMHLIAQFDQTGLGWSFASELRPLAACRSGHTATLTRVTEGTDTVRVVLVYGGAGAGEPVGEVIRLRIHQEVVDDIQYDFTDTALPSADASTLPAISGHAATTLADGRILIVGGQTRDGSAIGDGLIFDPRDDSLTPLPDLLATGRYGCSVTRLGNELVVAGGTGTDGSLVGDAEIFDVSTGGSPVALGTTPLAAPRTGHQTFVLPTNVFGLFGGVDAQGNPVTTIELYTPGLAP